MEWITILIDENELKATLESLENLEEITTDVSKEFFDRFDFPNQLLSNDPFGTLDRADHILHLIHRLNLNVYTKLHKGAVFYWMGIAAFIIRNYQLAVYYMDAAVSEDLKNDKDSEDTPARLFLRLEGKNPHQAGRNITQDAEALVKYYIGLYNKTICITNSQFSAISLDRIKSQLLAKAANSTDPQFRSLASLFISFFVEHDFLATQLLLRKEIGTNEPFFMHLFRGALLFESLLRNNPNKKPHGMTLNKILNELDSDLGYPGSLKDIGGKFTFTQVLKQLEVANDSIKESIKITTRIRNVVGHDIAWYDQIDINQFSNVFYSISCSCIHAISMLYG